MKKEYMLAKLIIAAGVFLATMAAIDGYIKGYSTSDIITNSFISFIGGMIIVTVMDYCIYWFVNKY